MPASRPAALPPPAFHLLRWAQAQPVQRALRGVAKAATLGFDPPVTLRPVTLRPVTLRPVTLWPVTLRPVTLRPVTLRQSAAQRAPALSGLRWSPPPPLPVYRLPWGYAGVERACGVCLWEGKLPPQAGSRPPPRTDCPSAPAARLVRADKTGRPPMPIAPVGGGYGVRARTRRRRPAGRPARARGLGIGGTPQPDSEDAGPLDPPD